MAVGFGETQQGGARDNDMCRYAARQTEGAGNWDLLVSRQPNYNRSSRNYTHFTHCCIYCKFGKGHVDSCTIFNQFINYKWLKMLVEVVVAQQPLKLPHFTIFYLYQVHRTPLS